MNIFLPRDQERVLLETYGEAGLAQVVSRLLKIVSENEELQEALMFIDRFVRYNSAGQIDREKQARFIRRLEKKLGYQKELVETRTGQIERQKQQIIDLKSQLASAQERIAELEAAQEARELNPPPPLPAVEPKVIERVVEKRIEVPVEVEKVVERPFDQKTFELAVDYAASERMRLACDEDNLIAAVRTVACREFLMPQPGNRSRFTELLFGMRREAQHEVVDKIVCEALDGVTSLYAP